MPTQQSYTSPGNSTFTVPADVEQILVEVWGAQGGDATVDATGSGGQGGYAKGLISVTPGEDLDINVGSAGSDSSTSNTADGGEASDVRQGGTTLSDRVLVGGGGGGAADGTRTSDNTNGGAGGASTGESGDDSGNPVGAVDDNIPGGTGGTQTSGGLSGGPSSNDGTFGFGGGGDTQDATPGGGAGGDGYYGGGGGGQRLDDDFSDDYASAGGGGSNFITASATNTVSTRGVQTGDGEILLTYSVVPDISITSLTETGETDVRVQATNANAYDSTGEWRVYRDGTLIETDASDADLDFTDTNATGGTNSTYRVDRVNDGGSDTVSQSIKVRLETVTGLAVISADAGGITIGWDAVPNAGSYEILRATASGSAYVDYTQVHNTSPGDPTEWEDTSVTGGTTYYYTIRAEANADSAYDSRYPGEISATASLLPPVIEDTTADSQSAITVTWSLQDSNTNGDVDVIVDSSVVATVAIGTTSYQATGFSEATSHDFEIRRDTGSATATSAVDTQFTKPIAPTLFDVSDITGDDITVNATDSSSGEDGFRRLDSTDGGTTFQQIGGDLSPTLSEATWEGLSRPANHTLKLRAFVGSGSEEATADSNTVERYLAGARASSAGSKWLLEIDHSNGNTVRFQPNEATFTPRLNTLPRFEATVGFDERWLSSGFDDATIRVWKDGRRLPIDTLVERPTEPGETTLRGRGGSQLRRQADTAVDQKPVYKTVEDLIDTRTDYVSNVDNPDAETTTNTLIQTASSQAEFKTIVGDFPDDVPLSYPDGGSGLIRAAQTCWLFMNDGGDAAPTGSFSEESDGTLTTNNWEDADVIRLDSNGDYVEFEFDVEHRINSADLGVALRREQEANDSNGDLAPMRLLLNGIELFDLDIGGDLPIGWSADYGSNYGFDLRPDDNPHTLRLEIDGAVASNAYYRLDVASVFDSRHHTLSNFPNQIETNTSNSGYLYLSGPAKYPAEVEVSTQDATPPVSLTGARLEVDIGGTYAAKQLELSPDQGSTYPLSATEAETLEGDFGSLAAQARSRITLGARGTGQNETPINGYASPELLDYRLYGDLDDTPLFVSENFQGSIEDVAIDGADYADAAWEIQWDDAAQTQSFEWTQGNQREALATTSISEFEFSRTTEERRDRIRVIGRSVPVNDEAFTADNGTAIQLSNSPILPDSEVVESSTTTFTQGQDYTVEWETGEITTLSSGNITDGESLVISYRWKPIGIADRPGASEPLTVRKVELPGLSTDRECTIAARRIRDATAEPLEEARVVLPPDAIGLEAIDELQFDDLPTDSSLEVNEISDDAGSQVARLGSRSGVGDVIDDIRRKLSSTAENS